MSNFPEYLRLLATIFSGSIFNPISIRKAVMTQLNNVVAVVCEMPGTDAIPVGMKLLDKDELNVVRLLVLKYCFIFANIAFSALNDSILFLHRHTHALFIFITITT